MPENKELDFNHIYRGTVIDNYDPEIKGRCKIYVPGVYPESLSDDGRNLPWAEPCMSIFGGSYQNIRHGDLNPEVGVTSIPHIGAQMWLFFENKNHMYPKYFAACQAGSGWMSEHDNQHIVKTDNVRIRIDENPGLSGSTCKFDSYNNEVGSEIPFSKERSFVKKPTRVDIQIKAENCVALNIQILGDVNMNIVGNVFERIQGDKHETHIGNLYKYHKGDEWINHDGATIVRSDGNIDDARTGDSSTLIDGSSFNMIMGTLDNTMFGPESNTHYDDNTECFSGGKTISAKSLTFKSLTDIDMSAVGNMNEQCAEKTVQATHDISNTSLAGNIVNNATGRGYYIDKTDTKYKFKGGVINESDYVMNMTQGSIVNCTTVSGMVYNQTDVNIDKMKNLFEDIRDEIRYAVYNARMILNPLNPEKWDWQYRALDPVMDDMGLVVDFVVNPQVVIASPTIKETGDLVEIESNGDIDLTAGNDIMNIAANTINNIQGT